MSRELVVLLNGVEAGVVEQSQRGRLQLTYADSWRDDPHGYPLSLSMPLLRRTHGDATVRAFMEGLLPDSDAVIATWARRFGVSSRNAFGLLTHVGEDVAGAVQFVPRERLSEVQERPGSVEWLSDAEVGRRLERLRRDHSAWRAAGDAGYFSLAGAQPKTALLHDGARWGLPSGRIATTHILKPPALELEEFALNEHLCLALAGALGIPAANSEVRSFGGQTVIVVQRYDRAWSGGTVRRVHQEDFCQALAVPPTSKYEVEGGPGATSMVSVLSKHSSAPGRDVDTFISSLALHWAIGAPDAHAKNYSLLLGPGVVRLAPLYDVLSVLPYPKEFFPRKVRLAMKIGGENRLGYISGRHWDRFAADNRLGADRVRSTVASVAERVPDLVYTLCSEAAAEGFSASFLARFRDALASHARRCRKALDSIAEPGLDASPD